MVWAQLARKQGQPEERLDPGRPLDRLFREQPWHPVGNEARGEAKPQRRTRALRSQHALACQGRDDAARLALARADDSGGFAARQFTAVKHRFESMSATKSAICFEHEAPTHASCLAAGPAPSASEPACSRLMRAVLALQLIRLMILCFLKYAKMTVCAAH